MNDAEAILEKRLTEHKKMKAERTGVGFDPTIILILIPVILELIKGCKKATPETVRFRLGARVRLARAIVQQSKADGEPMRLFKAYEEADELFDIADRSSDNEITDLIDCCK